MHLSGRDLEVDATFVGPEVDVLLHEATIAIVGQVPLTTLAHAIPFPRRSEPWLRFLEAYDSYERRLTLHAQSQLASAA